MNPGIPRRGRRLHPGPVPPCTTAVTRRSASSAIPPVQRRGSLRQGTTGGCDAGGGLPAASLPEPLVRGKFAGPIAGGASRHSDQAFLDFL